ncbi:hypothetical protein [Celeribacter persicus]|uniref:Transglycosylase-like protein with SLT domain n=1 Tax=Celeribacter persicus TaxID=1651082 RepID=A0A2T5H9V1_9RHOB|nr:hypothetical protein [Celeribacter persicus]PTQ68347.1 hypothetical protein C8N42_11559 [Celeribacter persicus]
MSLYKTAFAATLCCGLMGSALSAEPVMTFAYDTLSPMPEASYQPGTDHSYRVAHSEVTELDQVQLIRAFAPSFEDSATDNLKSLIASVEAAQAGYDAVVHSAWQKPSKPASQMTIGEIYDWIAATPNQNHAIGRYQLIPQTLKRLVRRSGLPRSTRYSKTTQDFLADLLLEEAGYSDFLRGSLSQRVFMTNLARIWAGLPTPSGRSYYHGVAGNRAVISWNRYERAMSDIFSGAPEKVVLAEVLPF